MEIFYNYCSLSFVSAHSLLNFMFVPAVILSVFILLEIK